MSLIIDKTKKKAIIAKLASHVIIGGATLLNNPVGVVLAASVAKAAFAFSKYKTTSHIQQADSIFSLVGYGASTAIRAGVATLPATALSMLNTISQVLFMRSRYAVCSSEPVQLND